MVFAAAFLFNGCTVEEPSKDVLDWRYQTHFGTPDNPEPDNPNEQEEILDDYATLRKAKLSELKNKVFYRENTTQKWKEIIKYEDGKVYHIGWDYDDSGAVTSIYIDNTGTYSETTGKFVGSGTWESDEEYFYFDQKGRFLVGYDECYTKKSGTGLFGEWQISSSEILKLNGTNCTNDGGLIKYETSSSTKYYVFDGKYLRNLYYYEEETNTSPYATLSKVSSSEMNANILFHYGANAKTIEIFETKNGKTSHSGCEIDESDKFVNYYLNTEGQYSESTGKYTGTGSSSETISIYLDQQQRFFAGTDLCYTKKVGTGLYGDWILSATGTFVGVSTLKLNATNCSNDNGYIVYEDAGQKKEFVFDGKYLRDLQLYSVGYNVTFTTEYGTASQGSILVAKGEYIFDLSAPVLTDEETKKYYFDGWYLGSQKITGKYYPTKHIDLTAKFKDQYCTLTKKKADELAGKTYKRTLTNGYEQLTFGKYNSTKKGVEVTFSNTNEKKSMSGFFYKSSDYVAMSGDYNDNGTWDFYFYIDNRNRFWVQIDLNVYNKTTEGLYGKWTSDNGKYYRTVYENKDSTNNTYGYIWYSYNGKKWGALYTGEVLYSNVYQYIEQTTSKSRSEMPETDDLKINLNAILKK